ncbi:MAG: hypothetical protein ACT4OG_08470 [Alphaproteobacteria bacterium]
MSQIGISQTGNGFFPRTALRPRALWREFPRGRAAVMGMAAALAVVLFDITLILFDFRAHVRFISEDRFVENLTVAFWLAGGAYILATLSRRTGWAWHLLLALAMIFMAGEEISWGQRIFSFATPPGLEAVNVQQEFNLHNISGIHESIKNTGYVLIFVGVVLLPLLQRISGAVNRAVARFAVPVARLDVILLVLLSLGLRVASRAIWHLYGVDNIFDETGELALSLAFFLFALDRTPIRR